MRSVALCFCLLSAVLVPVLAAPAAQAAGARVDRGERAVVRAINSARAHYGLSHLRSHRRLARAADAHTRHMLAADFFAHGAFSQRVRHYVSFRSIGETLAWSSRCSARRVVRMWLNSPGHRAVVLSGRYRRVGVGRRTGDFGGRRACVVTADFASRR
jgi:uncharacterized protein YkwD